IDPGPAVLDFTSVCRVSIDNPPHVTSDIVVAKLDPDGNLVWARTIGSAGAFLEADEHQIAVDGAGNAVVVGRFEFTVDFDPGPGSASLASNGNDDGFALKLDAAGHFVCARSVGGTVVDPGSVVIAVLAGQGYAA